MRESKRFLDAREPRRALCDERETRRINKGAFYRNCDIGTLSAGEKQILRDSQGGNRNRRGNTHIADLADLYKRICSQLRQFWIAPRGECETRCSQRAQQKSRHCKNSRRTASGRYRVALLARDRSDSPSLLFY